MPTQYFQLTPEEIINEISKNNSQEKVDIQGREYIILPDVYPSNMFRTTNFLLDSIKPLIPNATVCDMGCGMGIVGLFSLYHGAKKAVLADINPIAVENAKMNKELYQYNNQQVQIYKSDCFDNIPKQKFDLIIFNIPFHTENHSTINPLEYALHDPQFASTKKFVKQAKHFSTSSTQIIIAFSNKGDVEGLEKALDEMGIKWELWKVTNVHDKYDNRLYRCTIS